MQSVLRAPQLVAHGFQHGFSTRYGGVSAPPFATLNLGSSVGDDPAHVAQNAQRFAEWVGYPPERLFVVSQVHGGAVKVLRESDDPSAVRAEQADALVAGGGSGAIGIRTADCVPVLLADPETRCVAAVHAGWRGLVADVIAHGVRALCELSGAPASRLIGALFPHIGACCFEVGEEVATQLQAAARSTDVVVRRPEWPKPHVALDVAAQLQLRAAGLEPAHIDRVAGCTCCAPEQFYSFRRDGQRSGRHLTVIVGAAVCATQRR